MKKIILLLSTFLFSINICYAKNKIYNMDISVYVDEEGNASIEEKWDVKGSDGTEWFKVIEELGQSKITNFKVSMDGYALKLKPWDVDESLSEKKGYYGLLNYSDRYELCFGKYDFNRHTFTLSYNLSNLVFNVEDAQVIYFNFIDKLESVDFENFSLKIKTYYDIPDTLDVWGYGYSGYAYVKDGIIEMSNEDGMNDDYVVLLAKFPKDTFKTKISYDKFNNFDDVLNLANKKSTADKIVIIFSIIFSILTFLIPILIIFLIAKIIKYNGYGFIDNKKVDKKNTPMFRELFTKDMYYVNVLSLLNGICTKETNILGAILLKWIKENKVVIKKESEKNVSLIFNSNLSFDYDIEKELYEIMLKASGDGILEKKELEKWAKNNYDKYLNIFTTIKTDSINKLKSEGHIYKRTSKKECKSKNVMDDTLYEDTKKILGLKMFLIEFSSINEKEAIEVNLWDEYLMYAYIFGIADKVMKQFKNLYPEVISSMNEYNVDFDTLIILNHLSTSSISVASSAKSAAQAYSSGGGGFSSGFGGGGSFGGGGGGSR